MAKKAASSLGVLEEFNWKTFLMKLMAFKKKTKRHLTGVI